MQLIVFHLSSSFCCFASDKWSLWGSDLQQHQNQAVMHLQALVIRMKSCLIVSLSPIDHHIRIIQSYIFKKEREKSNFDKIIYQFKCVCALFFYFFFRRMEKNLILMDLFVYSSSNISSVFVVVWLWLLLLHRELSKQEQKRVNSFLLINISKKSKWRWAVNK